MLINGEEISHACEYEAVQGWRLAAVIHILTSEKKHYQWPIDHRDGMNGVRFYFLRAGTNASLLKKPKSYLDYLEKQGLLDPKEKGAATPLSPSDSNNPNPENKDK
jgi:hypothetical protein